MRSVFRVSGHRIQDLRLQVFGLGYEAPGFGLRRLGLVGSE